MRHGSYFFDGLKAANLVVRRHNRDQFGIGTNGGPHCFQADNRLVVSGSKGYFNAKISQRYRWFHDRRMLNGGDHQVTMWWPS
jgi:hypothetical protein